MLLRSVRRLKQVPERAFTAAHSDAAIAALELEERKASELTDALEKRQELKEQVSWWRHYK